MFGEFTQHLSSLFGRNFVIGHFVPAALFVYATLQLLVSAGWACPVGDPWRLAIDPTSRCSQPFALAAAAVLSSIVLAISLLTANIWILRRREGYDLTRVARLAACEKRRFCDLSARLAACQEDALEARVLAHDKACRFPPMEELLLPFAFGNVLRAFESYPLVMYGFEATRGWSRLLAVVPVEYREVMDAAKAEVDFLVNIWFLSHVHLLAYALLAGWQGLSQGWWPEPLFAWGALGSVALSTRYSVPAAMRWGELVKGAFDVYLPRLHAELGLEHMPDRKSQLQQWQQYSFAFLTRDRERLPSIAPKPQPRP